MEKLCLKQILAAMLLILGMVALHSPLLAQQDWTIPLKSPQAFIENKGQYDELGKHFGTNPRYVLDHGFGWQVLLSENSLHYLIQRSKQRREEGEELENWASEAANEVERSKISLNFGTLQGNWEAEAQQTGYFTYAFESDGRELQVNDANSFAKLRKRNAFSGIDLVLEAPEDGGIKYSFELAAQADPTQIQLEWSGASPQLLPNGDLRLPAVLGELIDHKPKAWYADDQSPISCEFVLSGNRVRFHLGNYDKDRAIVIDPWTVNPALPAPFNRAFEVDCDAAGNVYIFGGGMGYNLKKYSAAGSLIWTHVSPWDTSNAWFGELLVLPAGDVFITSGSAAKIRRLTAAGGTTFTNNGPFLNFDEYWNLSLSCNQTQLFGGGSRIISFTSPQGHFFNLNMSTGGQMSGSPINVSPVGMKEVRALCTGGNGNIYMLSNDNLIALNQTFGTLYNISSGISHPYYSPAYMAINVQGQNIIDANTAYIYVGAGNSIRRHDINTGALINSAAIPGGSFSGGFFGSGATNGGVVLDDCGSVYVGSTSSVIKYDANLNQIGSVATSSAVYDVWVAPGGVILIGGNGFLTSNTTLAACAPKTVSCVVLPAKLTSFEAQCHWDVPSLNWSIEVGEGLQSIWVERSQDGNNWEKRGEVVPAGSTEFHFQESEALPRPSETWYYRLNFQDQNGQFTPTSMVMLEACAEQDPKVEIVPNVTDDKFQLSFEAGLNEKAQLQLMDGLGRIVRSTPFECLAGKNVVEGSVAGLGEGVYFVRVIGESGRVWVRGGKVLGR